MRYIPIRFTTANGNRLSAVGDIHQQGKPVLFVKTSEDAFKISDLWNKVGATWEGDLDPLDLDTPPSPSV